MLKYEMNLYNKFKTCFVLYATNVFDETVSDAIDWELNHSKKDYNVSATKTTNNENKTYRQPPHYLNTTLVRKNQFFILKNFIFSIKIT